MSFRLPAVLLLCCLLPVAAVAGPARHANASTAAAAAPVNINSADVAALTTLKGIGEKKARAIVAYRKAHGAFATLADFEAVKGIGPGLIAANRDRIRFR